MTEFQSRPSGSQGPAGELLRNALSRIPTVFGRLKFLASLRDSGSGRYIYPALAGAMGEDALDWTLRYSHHQVFSNWLTFSLAQQKSDLDEFMSEHQARVSSLHYRDLVPTTARDVERLLFFTDLETLLELFDFDAGRSSPIRE